MSSFAWEVSTMNVLDNTSTTFFSFDGLLYTFMMYYDRVSSWLASVTSAAAATASAIKSNNQETVVPFYWMLLVPIFLLWATHAAYIQYAGPLYAALRRPSSSSTSSSSSVVANNDPDDKVAEIVADMHAENVELSREVKKLHEELAERERKVKHLERCLREATAASPSSSSSADLADATGVYVFNAGTAPKSFGGVEPSTASALKSPTNSTIDLGQIGGEGGEGGGEKRRPSVQFAAKYDGEQVECAMMTIDDVWDDVRDDVRDDVETTPTGTGGTTGSIHLLQRSSSDVVLGMTQRQQQQQQRSRKMSRRNTRTVEEGFWDFAI